MSNTADDPKIFPDFDALVFDSEPTTTENTSITEDVGLHQNLSLQECLEEVQFSSIQNERTAETIDYKAEYLKVLGCLEEKNEELIIISSNYDQLKRLLRKIMNDYVELHYECKKEALAAIEATTKLEKITEEIKKSQHKLKETEHHYSVTNTLYQAAQKNIFQLTKFVEKLKGDISDSKRTTESFKETMKEEKRKFSSLKYKLKTYEEDLCSIAGKLDRATEKKDRDRETQRQITKYTKKKLNSDFKNIDSRIVRGCFFSPAYSINFIPMNSTENFEQKMMRDASTSPLQTNETCDISELSKTSSSFDVRIKPNFTEIQSPVAQDNKESDDDLEVRMIFDKFRLDWNALSPMAITPDLDEEGLVQSKSDVRNDGPERQSPEHSGSQISKESDFLLVTPDYKKLPIPKNQSNNLKHNINEDNPSHINKIKVPKLHSITPIGHIPGTGVIRHCARVHNYH